ncbi:MAG: PQQ-binding-like beta-propeller repeat protein [Bdellovibrionales bacterium]|nr:PQQ-binding-like beta-propeller repeat protein [Bdellovibrionales bacterium]
MTATLRASFLIALAWTVLGCSGRNIHSDLKDDTAVMVRKWTLQTNPHHEAGDRGTEYSNAVLAENTLIFGSRTEGLVAVYPKILEVRWTLPIKGGVVSPIVLDRGLAYFGGGDGFVYAVTIENGRVAWRYDVRNPHISKPTVEGGRVFVTTSEDTVYAFDAGTGKWLWHYTRRSGSSATILGASQPTVDGNDVIVGLSDGFLVALNVDEGTLKWERKLHAGTKFTDVDSHPVVSDGMIYVSSYDGSLYALKRQGGQVVWKFDSGASKAVLVEKNRIYLPSVDGWVYALDKASAKVVWKFELDRGTPTDFAATDKQLIFGSSQRYLYVLEKETGKATYRFDASYESGFASAPAFDPATGRSYFLSSGGNLYAFQLRKKSPSKLADGFQFFRF